MRRSEDPTVCATCSAPFYARIYTPNARFCSRDCQLRRSAAWRGDGGITLRALHLRVESAYGKAREYPCFTQCCRPAKHWACVGDYSNTEEYVPMCVSCHKRFDLARIRAAKVAA